MYVCKSIDVKLATRTRTRTDPDLAALPSHRACHEGGQVVATDATHLHAVVDEWSLAEEKVDFCWSRRMKRYMQGNNGATL